MNPKQKGSGFERDIAKFLTEWVSGQRKEYYFWRSPGSGGVATVIGENGAIAGDIIALKPEGAVLTKKFSIECKVGYPQSSFHAFMNKRKKDDEITGFWVQCVNSAKSGNKIPMLIYKKKGFNTLVGVPFSWLKLRHIKMNFDNGLPECYLYDMEEFFKTFKPCDIKTITDIF